MKFYTFDPKKQKQVKVGEIIGDTLFKHVNNAKHFMRRVDGYGIQYSAFAEMQSKEIKYVIIKEDDTGKNWKSTVADWIAHGSTADFGWGKQQFLSLKYMKSHVVKIDSDLINR